MSTVAAARSAVRLPRQVPYIIGNEACERFSFYGMRNILTPFLVVDVAAGYAPAAERAGLAKDVFHSFVIGVYFFPLLGGWLSDRFFGKYNTVLWFSLIYCAGHALLAAFDDNRRGFYTGLFLIALGSGGIKPLVVSFVGDQFDQSNKRLAKVVFDAFYWSINFGSFFASLLMPIFLREYGPAVAFGIPGHPDGHRDAGLLAGPDAIRPGAADPRPGSALVLPRRRARRCPPAPRAGPARAGPGGRWRRAGGGAARCAGR